MAEFAVNAEVRVPGDLEENVTALMDAIREEVDEAESMPTFAGNEAARLTLVALRFDADDARDAVGVALEALDNAWEGAFPDLAPSDLMVVKAARWREAPRLGFLMPHEPDDDEVDDEELEPEEAEA